MKLTTIEIEEDNFDFQQLCSMLSDIFVRQVLQDVQTMQLSYISMISWISRMDCEISYQRFCVNIPL